MGSVISLKRSRFEVIEGQGNHEALLENLKERIARLGKFFKLSPGTMIEGMAQARRILERPQLTHVMDMLIKVRESIVFQRRAEYSENVTAFITRLAQNRERMRVINGLKAGTKLTARTEQGAELIAKFVLAQQGDLICLPVTQEEVVLSVRRNRLNKTEIPLGSLELLCELVANPARFEGKVFLADGEEVTCWGEKCVPSYSIEDGKIIIKPIPYKTGPKPAFRKLTGFAI